MSDAVSDNRTIFISVQEKRIQNKNPSQTLLKGKTYSNLGLYIVKWLIEFRQTALLNMIMTLHLYI